MKKQNLTNGNTSSLSSLRGAIATKQSISKEIAALPLVARNDRESGNALWFILIAIILLGLLTSMLTRSGSSTNDTGDYEQLTIQANEILNYAKSIENGVQSLLARGCSENELSFEANNNSGYVNPTAPADKSCHLFEPEGAGLTYIEPNEKWLDSSYNGNSSYQSWRPNGGMPFEDVGTTANELRLNLLFLRKNLCIVINNVLGVQNPSGDPPLDLNDPAQPSGLFTGIYSNGTAVVDNVSDDGGHDLAGKRSFCRDSDGAGNYQFTHVLLTR